jgi:hypothetical protein
VSVPDGAARLRPISNRLPVFSYLESFLSLILSNAGVRPTSQRGAMIEWKSLHAKENGPAAEVKPGHFCL